MKQIVRWSLIMTLAAPTAAVWSQAGGDAGSLAATTRPTLPAPRGDRGFGPRGEGMGHGDGMGPRGDGAGRRFRESATSNADDWADVEPFMRANSPVRLDMLKKIEDDLGADRPIAQVVRSRLVQRYHDLEQKRTDKPDLYAFAVKQLQAEDAVLGTLRDARLPNADPAQIELRLDAQVRTFVDNNLAERQARIDRLKKTLDDMTSSLDKDRGSIDALVAAQRDKFKKQMDAMLNFPAKGDDSPATRPTTKPAG